MSKRYEQYCPIAHALGLVGERWALLIVRELVAGPKRYTDLAANLPGIGTNILAGRLRDLEAGGVITKRRLPPPAASQVYELTPYGVGLKGAVRELALWGLRSLGPPPADADLPGGWLRNAIDTVFTPAAPPGVLEFRVGDEIAHLADGEARLGPAKDADVVVETDPAGFYWLLLERRWDGVDVQGDRELLERLLDAAAGAPASVGIPA